VPVRSFREGVGVLQKSQAVHIFHATDTHPKPLMIIGSGVWRREPPPQRHRHLLGCGGGKVIGGKSAKGYIEGQGFSFVLFNFEA